MGPVHRARFILLSAVASFACDHSMKRLTNFDGPRSMFHRMGLACRQALLPLFTLRASLALLSVGCTSPVYTVTPVHTAEDLPQMRESTIARLGECVQEYAPQMTPQAYSVRFEVRVTEDGAVQNVVTEDEQFFPHRDLQTCMKLALKSMSVPVEVFQTPSTAGSVTPESRRHIGIAQALGGAVALGPIVIAVMGVTIGVVVVVAAVKTENERCKEVKERCIEHCSDTVLNQGFHEPLFSRCLRTCMEKANCW